MRYINDELLEINPERWMYPKQEIKYTYWCEHHPDLNVRRVFYNIQNRNRYIYQRNKKAVKNCKTNKRFFGRVFGVDKLLIKQLPVIFTPVSDMYNFYIAIKDFDEIIAKHYRNYNPSYDSYIKMSLWFRVYMWLRLYEIFRFHKKPHNLI